MSNRQVWRQSGGRASYIPEGDITARITRADMGNYKLNLRSDREQVSGLLVRRVQ